MEITFASKKLQKRFSTDSGLRAEYGARMAKIIKRRLADLADADSLDEMRILPGRCHELKENLAGHLAVDLEHPYRLIFVPSDHPRPTKPDGGLDWGKVTRIAIVDVIDYHR